MQAWRGKKDQFWVCIEQEEPDDAWVMDLYVREQFRGEGIGRMIMDQTCEDADREGVTLWLEAMPFTYYDEATGRLDVAGPDMKGLISFYRSFDFRNVSSPIIHNLMRRNPK